VEVAARARQLAREVHDELSRDGTRLATGSHDKTARVWGHRERAGDRRVSPTMGRSKPSSLAPIGPGSPRGSDNTAQVLAMERSMHHDEPIQSNVLIQAGRTLDARRRGGQRLPWPRCRVLYEEFRFQGNRPRGHLGRE
jgi:hypothetical protein